MHVSRKWDIRIIKRITNDSEYRQPDRHSGILQ
jgi:hypothetical protein